MEIIGWAASLNGVGDSSGLCHLIVTRPSKVFPGQEVGGAACNAKLLVSGQCHKGPPDYSPHKCKVCEKIERRLLRAKEEK